MWRKKLWLDGRSEDADGRATSVGLPPGTPFATLDGGQVIYAKRGDGLYLLSR
jgi:hypothetical protein